MVLKFFGVISVKNERKNRQNQKRKPFFGIWTSQVFVSINKSENTIIKNVSANKKLSIENSVDEVQSRDMEEKKMNVKKSLDTWHFLFFLN